MQLEVGMILCGTVTRIAPFGAFVSLPENQTGMIHISEISSEFVRDIGQFLKEGDEVRVKVIGIDEKGRVNLSKKQAEAQRAPAEYEKKPQESGSFEDMMSKFLSASSDKMSDLKSRGEVPKRRRRDQ